MKKQEVLIYVTVTAKRIGNSYSGE